jgi:bifunctional DNase/RNase
MKKDCMEKIQLMVLGLSASPASNNAYALILKEVDGNRRLPIIIGAFEAQAIALEMEGMIPPRPMTHDLLKSVIENFGEAIEEVYISELREGTFYAKILFSTSQIEIDARPSDAIALAVRCNAPIYVNSDVMDDTGVFPQEAENNPADEQGEDLQFLRNKGDRKSPGKSKVEMLQNQLDKAVTDEDYERAAKLRDEIKKILESS